MNKYLITLELDKNYSEQEIETFLNNSLEACKIKNKVKVVQQKESGEKITHHPKQ